MWKQLTGEPVAGKLHSGFGGRGRRSPFPTPIPTPYCRRRTRPVPMAAKADDATHAIGGRMAVDGAKQSHEWLKVGREESLFLADHCLSAIGGTRPVSAIECLTK